MKYRSVNDYIDLAKAKEGVENDSRLALEHKMQPAKIHAWRTGRNFPNQEMVRELALWAGINVQEAMIEKQIWQSEKDGDQEGVNFWLEMLNKITNGTAHCVAWLAIAGILTYGTAFAGTNHNQFNIPTAPTIHYATLNISRREDEEPEAPCLTSSF